MSPSLRGEVAAIQDHEPPSGSGTDLTSLLANAAQGDGDAVSEVLALVYEKLRAIAQRKMGQERVDHTLEATALVHEAYLRLFPAEKLAWESRGQFYFAAARAMSQILVDHARGRGREKRVGRKRRVPLGVVDLASTEDLEGILALKEAVARLEETDHRAAQTVQLRFYAGLSLEKTAKVLEVSERTVLRDWNYARAWLARELALNEE